MKKYVFLTLFIVFGTSILSNYMTYKSTNPKNEIIDNDNPQNIVENVENTTTIITSDENTIIYEDEFTQTQEENI